MDNSKKQSFIQGAFFLMAAGLTVKIIGMFVKIPLVNLYGGVGNGIYTHAYNIYTFMYVVSTAGLPVAVARMVAASNALGRHLEVQRIASVAFRAFLIVGAVFTAITLLFVDVFTYFTTSAAYYAILAIAPMIFFTCIVSAIRGYFQGMSNMVPTAVSQVIEAMGKLIIGLGLAFWLDAQGYSLEIVVAGAIAGVTVGTLFSALYMLAVRALDKRRHRVRPTAADTGPVMSGRDILKALIKLAIPITIGAAVLSLTNLIDGFMVARRLQDGVGMTDPMATFLYGVYQMSVTLFNIPPALILSIGVSIIPAISGAIVLKNRERAGRLTQTAVRLTGLLAFPCAFGMAVLPNQLLSLIYFNRLEDVAIATPLLALLCPAMFFVSMVQVTNSILQAQGKEKAPVKNMAIGGVVKLVTNFILVGIPAINIHGAPIGTGLCYATIMVLNLRIIHKEGYRFSALKTLVRPFASAAAMGGFAWLLVGPVTGILGDKLGTVATVGLSAIFYLLMLLATKALPKEDILMLPKGEKIAKILQIK